MNIAIIDADLISRPKHRFPNLACMKLSAYYKLLGHNVSLKLDYENLDNYNNVFISKVFTDTYIPDNILSLSNIEYGGTGFYYDKAQFLPIEIEHCKPDYHLYDDWVQDKLSNGGKRLDYKYYLDYSIGFTTRFCFRRCPFCVNQNYTKVEVWANLKEFIDEDRPKICLLDDNMLGQPHWKDILEELQATGKPFQYKQGLDERLLNEEKCEMLAKSKYDGDFIFAFDNIADKPIIEKCLTSWRKYCNKNTKFYVLCSFDRDDRYDEEFWKQDIIDTFERIKTLMKFGCLPYIMRYEKYKTSPYYGTYVNLASWCNQPSFFKKKSYREWCASDDERKGGESATKRYFEQLENDFPDIAKKYFDMRYEELNEYTK